MTPAATPGLPEKRLREFLTQLSLPSLGTDWSENLLAPNLLAIRERVHARAAELAPALARAEITSSTATDVRVDADLTAADGSHWKATCIIQAGAPYKIEAMRFDPRPKVYRADDGYVIVLAGASSTGKSTIARALQDELDGPWLHLDRDAPSYVAGGIPGLS